MSDFIVQPMHNNLLIRKVDFVEPEDTPRIINADGTKANGTPDTQNTALVLAAGPGRIVGDKIIPCSVKAGDYIVTGGLVSKYVVGKEEFALINENSVVGKINVDLLPEDYNIVEGKFKEAK